MKDKRLLALEYAKGYIGVKEHPPGSNRGPLIDGWLRSSGVPAGNPWCMAFLRAMFEKAGMKIGGGASVGFFEQWAIHNGHSVVLRPRKGDVVCYRFDSDNWPDHVGIIEKVLALRWRGREFAGWIQIIEGNTALGNDANGGQVQRRRRWVKRCKFVRIKD